jgi:hypothetical protein
MSLNTNLWTSHLRRQIKRVRHRLIYRASSQILCRWGHLSYPDPHRSAKTKLQMLGEVL